MTVTPVVPVVMVRVAIIPVFMVIEMVAVAVIPVSVGIVVVVIPVYVSLWKPSVVPY